MLDRLAGLRRIWCGLATFCRRHAESAGYLALAVMIILLPCLYTPFWQACDDVFIAMLIKGYGLATAPSFLTTNSNAMWAFLVGMTPDFFSISSYTWLQYFLISISLFLLWAALVNDRNWIVIKFLFLINLCYYVLLNPQYTVTAFFCAMAGFITLARGDLRKNIFIIVLACGLLYFSFIIRSKAFYGILLIGWPLVEWKGLLHNKGAIICLFLLCIFAGISAALDSGLKSDSAWKEIDQWRQTREDLADTNSAEMFRNQPELLAAHALTDNDMRLLQYQFSGDPALRDTEIYEVLKQETGWMYYLYLRTQSALKALLYIFDWPIKIYTYIIILLTLLSGHISARNCMILGMLILSLLAIGFLSRGGENVLRVYFPLLFFVIALLLIAPTDINVTRTLNIGNIIYLNKKLVIILLLGLMFTGIHYFSKSNLLQQWRMTTQAPPETRELFHQSISFAWPDIIEWIYKPFDSIDKTFQPEFQGLTWTLLDPYARKYFDPRAKDGFASLLEEGHKFAVTDFQLEALEGYCQEHLNGKLHAMRLSPNGVFPVYYLQCMKTNASAPWMLMPAGAPTHPLR